ncbi:MAG: hypothetical protein ACOVQA_02300, partial [Thermoflexibacteraceae bacterium]
MIGYRFQDFVPPDKQQADFEKLLNIFLQLLTMASGDVAEAMQWLSDLDRQYQLTNQEYGIGDFFEDLNLKNLKNLKKI